MKSQDTICIEVEQNCTSGENMNPSTSNNRCFEEIFLEAVDEVLSSLGLSVKSAVYFYLEKSFNLERQKIPYKIEKFAGAIEEIFGFGAKLLEIQIMKSLNKKVGRNLRYVPKRELDFVRYVRAIRTKYNSNVFGIEKASVKKRGRPRKLKNQGIEVVSEAFLECTLA